MAALTPARREELDAESIATTLGSVLKYSEDLELARSRGLEWVAVGD